MKSVGYLVAAGALFLQLSAANAGVFSWSYTDGGANTGSGTLTATPTALPEQFQVTSITGTANGFTITSLANYALPGQVVYWSPTSPTHFDPLNVYYHLDFTGVGFKDALGNSFNFYEDAFNGSVPLYQCDAAYCLIGPGVDGTDGVTPVSDTIVGLTDFALTRLDVPEPLTLSLFGAGIAGMAGLRRRKKTKAA